MRIATLSETQASGSAAAKPVADIFIGTLVCGVSNIPTGVAAIRPTVGGELPRTGKGEECKKT